MTTTGSRRFFAIPSPLSLLSPFWRDRRHFGAGRELGVVGDIGITRGDLYATVAGTWWRDAVVSPRFAVVRRVVPIERREDSAHASYFR